jgi:phosphopantetheinyl transferase (holo-ACP synthase)
MGTGWSGGHKFSEIEVVNNALGKPVLFVHGKVKEFCEAHGIGAMEVC